MKNRGRENNRAREKLKTRVRWNFSSTDRYCIPYRLTTPHYHIIYIHIHIRPSPPPFLQKLIIGRYMHIGNGHAYYACQVNTRARVASQPPPLPPPFCSAHIDGARRDGVAINSWLNSPPVCKSGKCYYRRRDYTISLYTFPTTNGNHDRIMEYNRFSRVASLPPRGEAY